MKTFQDIYPKVRDDALAAYAQAHPAPQPYDADAKKMIRLLTYLWLWGDLYRESLWEVEKKLAQGVQSAAGSDPIAGMILDCCAKGVPDNLLQHTDSFANTAYPEVFKAWFYKEAAGKINGSSAGDSAAAKENLSALPNMIQKWGHLYEQQIKKPLPNSLLFSMGQSMQDAGGGDESGLNLVHTTIDQAFATAAPDNPVKDALDGAYWTDEAWLARGGGWANTVTPPQWQKFKEDLEKADNVLESAYAKHPEEAAISVVMLKVELGQGMGRDRMEQWFQRAIKSDPQNAQAYSQKYWYLQPRWYGSVDDLVSFGKECMSMPDPPPSGLSGFGIAIAQASTQEPDVYKRPEVWIPLEKMYRLYLERFPQSYITRTGFALHAAQSERWDIVKEQFALLGENWDHGMITPADYNKYAASANAASGK